MAGLVESRPMWRCPACDVWAASRWCRSCGADDVEFAILTVPTDEQRGAAAAVHGCPAARPWVQVAHTIRAEAS